jgi:hypothetical protein
MQKIRGLASEYMPINSEVVDWATKEAEFIVDDMLKRYPKLTPDLTTKLASSLHIPVTLLFFPDTPQGRSGEEILWVMNSVDPKILNPTVRLLFRKAKGIQLILEELYGEGQLKRLEWLNMPVGDHSISELVANIRKLFGVSIEEQGNWRNSKEALDKWIEIFTDKGVGIFKRDFGDDNVSGFCIYDKLIPVIFLNSSTSNNRQIFTMFRELAYLLFGRSHLVVFDNEPNIEHENPDHIEVRCNRFAWKFLLSDNENPKDDA